MNRLNRLPFLALARPVTQRAPLPANDHPNGVHEAPRRTRTSNLTAAALVLTGALIAFPSPVHSADEKLPGPLFDNLGDYHHPVTTSSKLAQRYFDQGLTLLHGFNHKEAIRSFRSAAKLDPHCAMAWWGVAYACGPHVNKPMFKEDNDGAWSALQQGLAIRSGASAREQAYLDALAKRYQATFSEDRLALDKAFADAMRELVKQYPDDLDAQTFFAEALMNTMPWDYWLKDRSPKPETEEAFAALRFVLARNPNHPGANHFYIHAVEAGPNPEWGLPAADRLRELVPGAGHLVHMPSHIYMRVGQYHDATLANERAVKADCDYISRCKTQGFYPGVYYPHNLHFLWYAQAFEGRSKDALRTANQAAQYALDNYCGPNKSVEGPRLRHLPWLTLAHFGRWDDLLKVAKPPATNDFLVDRVMWHFTRGLALAADQRPEPAATELAELSKLVHSDEAKALDNPQFPATQVLRIAEMVLAGRIASARGDHRAAIDQFGKAVAAEDAMPYMEPAYWPFPTRPALGAALLRSGSAVKAEQVFRDDLKHFPRNGRGLFGLEQSLRAQGKAEHSAIVRRQFEESWQRADVKLELEWF
jgi:tetratricopeptide (TPR) repeat protein